MPFLFWRASSGGGLLRRCWLEAKLPRLLTRLSRNVIVTQPFALVLVHNPRARHRLWGFFFSGLKQVGKAELIAENKRLLGHELEVEPANLRHTAVRLTESATSLEGRAG
jgi:hypothetical protein